jgi:2-desacetyl-2-hydroxyethyl bacteriochlorophyllide A dehydrogenase
MKAAVFYGEHDIRVEERGIQPPLDNEVVIRVAFCGVCGTDRHIYHGEEGSAETIPPIVLGHEMSGIVHEVGGSVTRLQPGDHVAVDPNFYCGECHYCRSGLEHFCSEMNGIGTTRDGGFAEYCTVPSKALIKIPEEIPLEVAAFAEPLACCLHGIDLTNIRIGDQVLLIGAGSIGLLMLQLSKLAGASRLSVIEPGKKKRELAEKLGADATFASGEEYLAYAEKSDGIRCDRVIECVGKTETVTLALQAASKGATVMLFGLTPPNATVEIKPFEIFKKELHITSSFVNPLTESRALELLASGKVRVTELIEELVPLDKLATVLTEPSYLLKTKVMVELI